MAVLFLWSILSFYPQDDHVDLVRQHIRFISPNRANVPFSLSLEKWVMSMPLDLYVPNVRRTAARSTGVVTEVSCEMRTYPSGLIRPHFTTYICGNASAPTPNVRHVRVQGHWHYPFCQRQREGSIGPIWGNYHFSIIITFMLFSSVGVHNVSLFCSNLSCSVTVRTWTWETISDS